MHMYVFCRLLADIFELQPPWWDFYYAKTWWNVYAQPVNTCSNTKCLKEVVVFNLLLVTTLQSTDKKITISYQSSSIRCYTDTYLAVYIDVYSVRLHEYLFSHLHLCIFSSFTCMHIQFAYIYTYYFVIT